MNLDTVMDAIANQLGTITGLRAHAYPPDMIEPPAAVVTWPDITFDGTYGRGMDRLELPVVVAVGKPYDRATRALMAPYVAGSGAKSIKAVVESGTYTAFDTVRVSTATFDVISIGGVEFLAATFTLDIAGRGA